MDKHRIRTSWPPFVPPDRSSPITVLDGKIMLDLKIQLWEMKEGKISKVKAGDHVYKFTLIEPEEAAIELAGETNKEFKTNTEVLKELDNYDKKKHNKGNRGNTIFDQKGYICTIHSVRIYKPLVEYLTENVPRAVFHLREVSSLITKYYKNELKRSIKDTAAEKYSAAYCIHLISNNILKKLNRFDMVIKLPSKTPEKTLEKTLEKNTISIKQNPAEYQRNLQRKDDTAEFLGWLNKWEHTTFTHADIRRCTTLSKQRIGRIIEDQLNQCTIKRVSDHEFTKR